MAYHCAVKGCGNGAYRLKNWQKEMCAKHDCHNGTASCTCSPPFRLFPFPTQRKNPVNRQLWKEAVNRAQEKKPWKFLDPSKDQRVCSQHFTDGEPTKSFPVPELLLGYDTVVKKVLRKKPLRSSVTTASSSSSTTASVNTMNESAMDSSMHVSDNNENHDEMMTSNEAIIVCLTLIICNLIQIIFSLQQEIVVLKQEIEHLQSKNRESVLQVVCKKKQHTYHKSILKNDTVCNFFTGIRSLELFKKLHDFVQPYVKRRWKGISVTSSKVKRRFKKSPSKFGPQRKLNSVDEFLMVLMKLKLGLMNNDLAVRFNISATLVSQIFYSWITAMSQTLGCMVFWPEKDQILATKPVRYRHLPSLVSIIDCSEIFVETPKNMDLQFMTWSDYKHHNTIKFLISVAPNSAITYISPLYCGRISDKALTLDCGYMDLLNPHDSIMADKGFLLQKECDARFIHLSIPPGKRGASQMLPNSMKKTKEIANIRILVEQIIRRLKSFKILSHQMPITMVPCADKILRVCAALCNLYNPMYKY